MFTQTILTCRLPHVQLRIADLNRKAEKLGLAPVSLSINKQFTTPVEGANDLALYNPLTGKDELHYTEYSVSEEKLKLSGYTLVGKVEGLVDGGRVLQSMEQGFELPESLRTGAMYCDHCKTNRARKDLYVFRNEAGALVRVGRQCVKDYFGISPAVVAFYAGLLPELSNCDTLDLPHSAAFSGIWSKLFVTACVASILERGFVKSSGRNFDPAAKTPSWEHAAWLLSRHVCPKDRAEARQILDRHAAAAPAVWEALQVLPQDTQFNINALAVIKSGLVEMKHMALVAGAVQGILKAAEREDVRKAAVAEVPNEHFGEVGKRVVLTLRFMGQAKFETQFGMMYVGRFATPNGLAVYKGSSPFWGVCEIGRELTVKATIKEHGEYKGTKQTFLSRVVEQ